MISKEDVKKLADLARIDIGDEEAESLGKDMDSILEYVGQVSTVAGDAPLKVRGVDPAMRGGGDIGGVNVFREDSNPTESGTYSKDLIAEFPDKEGDYLKVKKIL